MKKEAIIKFYVSYRLYIFPFIVAFSSLILIVLIIFPQIYKLITNQKTEGELTNKSKFLEVKAQTLESFDAADLSNKANLSLLSYPPDKDFGNVIGLIQNLTTQSGFVVVSMSIGTTTVKIGESDSYSIQLNVTGPKSLSKVFISNIEGSTRLMKVGNIEISNTSQAQIANLSLNLNVLYAPIPTSFGSIDSVLPTLSESDEQLLAKISSNNTQTISETPTNVQLPSRGKTNPFE